MTICPTDNSAAEDPAGDQLLDLVEANTGSTRRRFISGSDGDSDGDGVTDATDAFPAKPNESVDTDGDGTGNNADAVDDGDDVANSSGAFPVDASETLDADLDGIGNAADMDDDGDGVPNDRDLDALDAAIGATDDCTTVVTPTRTGGMVVGNAPREVGQNVCWEPSLRR